MLRRIACLLSAACLFSAAAPEASAQRAFGRNFPWIDVANQFEPSWLVVCTPSPTATACPVDGMALLPSPGVYTNLSLRILGGPFTQRWQVENLRASLIRELNMPSHAMYVFVVDSAGRTLGGFWLGARPTCTDLYAQGPLQGDIAADLSPTVPRPEAMPVTDNAYGAYLAYVERIRPECEARRSRGRPSTIPEGMPLDGPR